MSVPSLAGSLALPPRARGAPRSPFLAAVIATFHTPRHRGPTQRHGRTEGREALSDPEGRARTCSRSQRQSEATCQSGRSRPTWQHGDDPGRRGALPDPGEPPADSFSPRKRTARPAAARSARAERRASRARTGPRSPIPQSR